MLTPKELQLVIRALHKTHTTVEDADVFKAIIAKLEKELAKPADKAEEKLP